MIGALEGVCAARIPRAALERLAGLRADAGVRVLIEQERIWLSWSPDDVQAAACVLPIPGAELFLRRDGNWYRPGGHLPVFGLPLDDEMKPLHQVLLPAPVYALSAEAGRIERMVVGLARSTAPARASAGLCPLTELARWSEQAPVAVIESLRGAQVDGDVLIVGARLPALNWRERFHGKNLLAPLGYRVEPDLPESAVRAALRVDPEELLLFRQDGVEIVPAAALEPISRAGIRLLLADMVSRNQAADDADRADLR